MNRPASLGAKILTGVLVGTLAVLLSYELVSFRYFQDQSIRAFATLKAGSLDRLETALKVPLWDLDLGVVQGIIRAELSSPSIQSIEVLTERGTVFAAASRLAPGNAELWLYRLAGVEFRQTGERAMSWSGIQTGRLRVVFVFDDLWKEWLSALRRFAVEFGLFVALFTGLVGLGFLRLIKRPLRMILKGLDAIKAGDFEQPIALARRDELGQLAGGIDAMARELRQSYHRLEEQNTRLEELVADRTAKLVDSEKRAVISRLVTGVAHELNTPIGLVLTMNSHLAHKLQEFRRLYESGAMARTDLEAFLAMVEDTASLIDRSAVHSAELIRSFKQVSVDHYTEAQARFKVMHHLRELTPMVAKIVEKVHARLSVEGDESIEITSYPNFLTQIVVNLAINTVMHAFEGQAPGERTVSIQANPWKDGLCLEYRNNGAAIPPANLTQIFEPFFTTGRQAGGTGLGLFIIKGIIEQRLGGSIRVRSPLADGRGVAFEIRIPSAL